MTRKHFVAMARIIKEARALEQAIDNGDNPSCSSVAAFVADELAKLCRSENSQFDRSRFLRACGLE